MERTAAATTEMPNAMTDATPRAPATTAKHRAATAAVLAAVLLGMLGDGLFRVPYIGINLLLWACAAVGATVWVATLGGRAVRRDYWALAIPIVFFAGVFTWRGGGELLLLLNMVGMMSAFGMLALAVAGWPRDITRASVGQLVLGGASLGLSGAVGGPLLVASDRALSDGGAQPRLRVSMAVARGVLLALPILFIFGALLSAADPRFERLITTLVDIDFLETIGHIVFAGFIAWVAAGYLRAAAVAERPLGVTERRGPPLSLGIAELATVLGLIDVLFALFVAIQLPHLFGGAGRVRDVAGLTVAEYARGGFFELVTVAALVLPVLLAGAALVRRDTPRDWRAFRWLSFAMLALVSVMIISALQRLTLYVASFGLSEERVYATAAVIWLAIVFAVFVATVLRRRDGGFAFSAVVSGWLVLAALDVANPQALVARVNIDRAVEGAEFDWRYATRLDADAVPALAAALTRLDDHARCAVAAKLAAVADDREAGLPEDWRGWNVSRTRAFRAARDSKAREMIASCPANINVKINVTP